jgi:anthranilate 1,2-dioxygenase small subunit
VYADSKAMIRDRAFAIKHTQMYAPRTLQHFVTNVRVLEAKGPTIKAQSNYLLLQTLVDGPTSIQQSGRYYDTFVRVGGRLLLKERQCIYDTVLIANDLVLPV